LRIARCLDEASLRRLAAAVQPGSGARLEVVCSDGRRAQIACGIDETHLRLLLEAERDSDCWLELTFASE
jgi:hypothetical protein